MLAYSARLGCGKEENEQGLANLKEALRAAQKLRSPYELCVVHRVSMEICRQFPVNRALEATFSSFLTEGAEAYREKALTALAGIEDWTERRYLE